MRNLISKEGNLVLNLFRGIMTLYSFVPCLEGNNFNSSSLSVINIILRLFIFILLGQMRTVSFELLQLIQSNKKTKTKKEPF